MSEAYLKTSSTLWTSWLDQTSLCRLCGNVFIVHFVNVVGAVLANQEGSWKYEEGCCLLEGSLVIEPNNFFLENTKTWPVWQIWLVNTVCISVLFGFLLLEIKLASFNMLQPSILTLLYSSWDPLNFSFSYCVIYTYLLPTYDDSPSRIWLWSLRSINKLCHSFFSNSWRKM